MKPNQKATARSLKSDLLVPSQQLMKLPMRTMSKFLVRKISKVENPKAVDEITVIGTSKMTERTFG